MQYLQFWIECLPGCRGDVMGDWFRSFISFRLSSNCNNNRYPVVWRRKLHPTAFNTNTSTCTIMCCNDNHASPGFACERMSAAQNRSSAAQIPPHKSCGRAGAKWKSSGGWQRLRVPLSHHESGVCESGIWRLKRESGIWNLRITIVY